MPTDDLLSAQSAMNRSTRGQWQMYGAHRQQIERLIVPERVGGRACVLGAGNCNDLDLKWMTQVYREVHLLDLDADALAAGVKKQQCEHSPHLRLHAPVDLSGVAELVSHWKQSPPDEKQIDECLRRMETPIDLRDFTVNSPSQPSNSQTSVEAEFLPPPVLRGRAGEGVACEPGDFSKTPSLTLPRSTGGGNRAAAPRDMSPAIGANTSGFELVLSPCVLSQLLIGIRDAIGSTHTRYPALRAALRQRHIRNIVDLLTPNGTGVLVIDLASTEDFPGIARVSDDDDAADLMRTLVEKGKCFAALAPAEIHRAMQPLVASKTITEPRFTRPWIWHLGLHKAFLVYAVLFTKRNH